MWVFCCRMRIRFVILIITMNGIRNILSEKWWILYIRKHPLHSIPLLNTMCVGIHRPTYIHTCEPQEGVGEEVEKSTPYPSKLS